MSASEQPSAAKPVWEVHARPINASREPWRVLRVEARSAIQAEAILRRRGYEMAVQTAVRCARPGQIISPAELHPLACRSCGYLLSGLTIERASVCCPECSFDQPLVCWNADAPPGDRPHVLVILLAVVGGLAIGFIALIALAVIVSL